MAHSHTDYLGLLKIDPNVEMSLSDFVRFFRTDKDTVDANIKAVFDRIDAIAAQGYTPISPVNIASSSLTVQIENAATGYFNLPTLLATFPEHTPVRITGFIIKSLTSPESVDAFFSTLDRLYGLDASNCGVTKAQMHGVIDMGDASITGEQVQAWENRYPDITIISTTITNKVYYYNFDGSKLLHTETVGYGNNAAWIPSASYTDRSDHPDGYFYVFDGWAFGANASAGNPNLLKAVTETKIVYAAYIRHPRTGPSLTVVQQAKKVTDTVIATIDYLETFNQASYLLYNKADGSDVTNKSVSTSGDVILDNNILTIHMFSDLFTGYNHALYFKEPSAAGGREVSVPIVIIQNKPYLHVEQFVRQAGDTAVVKIAHWGKYQRVNALTYKLSGNAEDTVAESPSVVFNMDAANSRFTIRMTSSAMLSATFFLVFEDSSGDTVNVPLPNLKTIR